MKTSMQVNQVPQGQTIIAFLKSKGWEEQSRDQHQCVLTPPASMALIPTFEYRVPLNDSVIDYREYAIRAVFSIADFIPVEQVGFG